MTETADSGAAGRIAAFLNAYTAATAGPPRTPLEPAGIAGCPADGGGHHDLTEADLRAILDLYDTARERLTLARLALLDDDYFKPGEIGDDIAPRITELLSHLRAQIDAVRTAAAEWRTHARNGDEKQLAAAHALTDAINALDEPADHTARIRAGIQRAWNEPR